MPRKNSNAGQPNRVAQTTRRAVRRENNVVYGPGSKHLNRIPVREVAMGASR